MIKSPLNLLLITTISLVIALCGSLGSPEVRRPRADVHEAVPVASGFPSADCACELARRTNGWCRSCDIGYVASIRIPSPTLFEALDAHGHAIEPDLLRCDGCRAAVETDGFCDRSGIGYVGGQAYLSKLAYYAAKGEVKNRSTVRCVACRRNAEGHGWCESCGIGRVGPLALEDRAEFEEAREAIDRLARALGRLDDCETCAVATVTGGRCSFCRVSY